MTACAAGDLDRGPHDAGTFLVGEGLVLTERAVGNHPVAAVGDQPPDVLGVGVVVDGQVVTQGQGGGDHDAAPGAGTVPGRVAHMAETLLRMCIGSDVRTRSPAVARGSPDGVGLRCRAGGLALPALCHEGVEAGEGYRHAERAACGRKSARPPTPPVSPAPTTMRSAEILASVIFHIALMAARRCAVNRRSVAPSTPSPRPQRGGTTRHGRGKARIHPASMAKPPRPYGWRDPDRVRRVSELSPRAIARQNRTRSSRHATLGRPGEMESFWSSTQIELLNRKRWKTRVELANGIWAVCRDPLESRHRDSGGCSAWTA